MKNKQLITTMQCNLIKCDCGTELMTNTNSVSTLIDCGNCGSIYDKQGKFLMKPINPTSIQTLESPFEYIR